MPLTLRIVPSIGLARHARSVFRPLRDAILLSLIGFAVDAQVVDVRSVTPPSAAPTLALLKDAQREFESYRRRNLPAMSHGRAIRGECDERVGRFCYWYDEREQPPPPEPERIKEARTKFIAKLDSAANAFPGDKWVVGQLVRYLAEAGRYAEGVRAARSCTAKEWWCFAALGFAYHVAAQYAEAETAFTAALALMDEDFQCEWGDMKLLLDDELLRTYRDFNCKRRQPFESRVWWLARPMMSGPGDDARTEYYARIFMTYLLQDAPSIHSLGFDADERELLLRYGWPHAWTRESGLQGPNAQPMITGHEPAPAPPMLPMAPTVRNPALSDSLGWRGKGLPGVRARYAPAHVKRLLPLKHQAAVFRRGDSALVVMAYDVSEDSALAAAAKARNTEPFTAALVLTRGTQEDATIARLGDAGPVGTITARAPWGQMLMSAEVAAFKRKTLARARYGLRVTDLPGLRVTVSDLLLFDPYADMPSKLEDVLPHARRTLALSEGSKVGIYWETYNTSPLGEGMNVSITVAPEEKEGNWLRRSLTALKLVREAQPVTMGMRDVSARGLGYTPRSVIVDLSTLKPGRYLLQVEVTADGAVPVRAERPITVR